MVTQRKLFDVAAVQSSPTGQATLLSTLGVLASRLALTRPLAVFDIESTGPLPVHDRIIELAVGVVSPAGEAAYHCWLVNPGIPIPPEASAVHGIADADVAGCPPFAAIATDVAAVMTGSDVAGFNVARFDVTMLVTEFGRAGVSAPIDKNTRIVDAYRIFVQREPRDLAAAVRFYCPGVEAFRAHRAGADVDATARVLLGQLDRYAGDLPADVGGLHDICDPRDPSWLDDSGKIVWRDGEARISFGKQAGRTLRELAASDPGFLRWMLTRDFGPDVLSIVSAALEGRFPAGFRPPSLRALPTSGEEPGT
jgi:DNA polymerase-3 subunit epsilon